MNREEYLDFHRASCDKMVEITAAKNHDYCGVGDDPFANFRRVEVLGITDTLRGFLVRMTDKFSRITSFVQKGILLVKDESVEDTLLDLSNYCILMAGFIKSEKEAKVKETDLQTPSGQFTEPPKGQRLEDFLVQAAPVVGTDRREVLSRLLAYLNKELHQNMIHGQGSSTNELRQVHKVIKEELGRIDHQERSVDVGTSKVTAFSGPPFATDTEQDMHTFLEQAVTDTADQVVLDKDDLDFVDDKDFEEDGPW